MRDPHGEIDQERQERMSERLLLKFPNADSTTKEKLIKSQSDGSFWIGFDDVVQYFKEYLINFFRGKSNPPFYSLIASITESMYWFKT